MNPEAIGAATVRERLPASRMRAIVGQPILAAAGFSAGVFRCGDWREIVALR